MELSLSPQCRGGGVLLEKRISVGGGCPTGDLYLRHGIILPLTSIVIYIYVLNNIEKSGQDRVGGTANKREWNWSFSFQIAESFLF